ncbi:MAG: hypothetical protein LBD48_09320 [Treponema sp.]|nr:hypothetical protein [Treponema sp.]
MKNSKFFVLGILAIFVALGFVFAGCDNGGGDNGGGGGTPKPLEPVLFTGVTNGEVVDYDYESESYKPYTGGAKTFGFYGSYHSDYVQADWSGYNVSIGSNNKLTVQLGTPGNDKLGLYPFPSEEMFDPGNVTISPSSARFLPIETFSTTNEGYSTTELEFSKALSAHSFIVGSIVYCNTNAAVVATSGGIVQAVNFKTGWNLLPAPDSGYKWRIRGGGGGGYVDGPAGGGGN